MRLDSDKNMKIKKIVIATIIIISISLLLIIPFFADNFFNGLIKTWFYDKFIDQYLDDDLYLVNNFHSWNTLKIYIYLIFIATILFISVLIYIICKHYRNKLNDYERRLADEELKSARHEQLLTAQAQQKNDLITYLAHDLKTPLASIIGYLTILEESPDIPIEQRAKFTNIALTKAYRLENLINEFFEITRFNLQKIVINKSKVNLKLLLEQVCDEFYPIVENDNKSISLSCDEITIWADGDKLARVINNVIRNACNYSYPDSIIQITAKLFINHDDNNNEWLNITFINQGDPIPENQLNLIFEKFYRLDEARSTRSGGAGLGLAIAKEIVTAHSGTISAESTRDYTKFMVNIPNN